VPFLSEAQRRWMHEHDPKMAARWEAETKGPLPDHVPAKEKAKPHPKPVKKVRKTKKPKVGK
jgi:hypothetical protein